MTREEATETTKPPAPVTKSARLSELIVSGITDIRDLMRKANCSHELARRALVKHNLAPSKMRETVRERRKQRLRDLLKARPHLTDGEVHAVIGALTYTELREVREEIGILSPGISTRTLKAHSEAHETRKAAIEAALQKSKGHVSNAAKELGYKAVVLMNYMQDYGIRRVDYMDADSDEAYSSALFVLDRRYGRGPVPPMSLQTRRAREALIAVLKRCEGSIPATAAFLGLTPTTVYGKTNRYCIPLALYKPGDVNAEYERELALLKARHGK